MICKSVVPVIVAIMGITPVAFADACAGAETQLKAIELHLAHNSVSAAENLLAPLQASNPDCAELILIQARIAAAKDQASEAQTFFFRYTDLMPKDPAGYAYFARFFIYHGEYQRADTLSTIALENGPENPTALAVRGQVLDIQKHPEQGLEFLSKASHLDPEDAETQFQLGILYDHATRPRAAVPCFERAVQLDPNNASAWDYLALNLEPIGEVDRADNAYRKGLEVNRPGLHFDAFLDYNYGRFLTKRNQLEESKKHFDRAIELVPQVRAIWYDRAKLNVRMQKYQEAKIDAEKAESLTEQAGGIKDVQVYTLLAQIYQRLGEVELAKKYAGLSRESH